MSKHTRFFFFFLTWEVIHGSGISKCVESSRAVSGCPSQGHRVQGGSQEKAGVWYCLQVSQNSVTHSAGRTQIVLLNQSEGTLWNTSQRTRENTTQSSPESSCGKLRAEVAFCTSILSGQGFKRHWLQHTAVTASGLSHINETFCVYITRLPQFHLQTDKYLEIYSETTVQIYSAKCEEQRL